MKNKYKQIVVLVVILIVYTLIVVLKILLFDVLVLNLLLVFLISPVIAVLVVNFIFRKWKNEVYTYIKNSFILVIVFAILLAVLQIPRIEGGLGVSLFLGLGQIVGILFAKVWENILIETNYSRQN